jgi:hypothetical protein
VALLAERIIESARDRHAAFDRRRVPDPSALRFLSAYRKELAGKVAKIDETALVTTQAQAMPLVTFDSGITLTANRYIAGVTAKTNQTTPQYWPVDLIPWAHRNDINSPLAAAWEYGGKLYLRPPATAWRDIVEIGIALVATMATDLAALTDDVGLPPEAEKACVEATALFMAKRGHNDPTLPAISLASFNDEAIKAEGAYLEDVNNRNTGRHFRTRDVNPYGSSW